MIDRTINPDKDIQLRTSDIDRSKLEPRYYTMSNGRKITIFDSNSIDIIKVDFVFEAGKAYQAKKVVALLTNKLITEGTSKHTAKEIAEILDFRGIYIDKSIDSTSAFVSVLMIKKYVQEILPLLYEILTDSIFPENEFQVALNKGKQSFLNDMMKPQYVARRNFYQAVFGEDHVYGSFATESDFDKITPDDVRGFFKDHYLVDCCDIYLSGNVDDEILSTVNSIFGSGAHCTKTSDIIIPQPIFNEPQKLFIPKADAVQSAIRIGKVIDTTWDSTDFAELMIANTILGGYFGSRLIANVREDKGYCYSIYSLLQCYRGVNVFFITTEVGKDVTDNAVKEIHTELYNMATKPVDEEELSVVKSYLIGDFIRSIDGVFEIAERYKQMCANHSSEVFTDNYLKAINTITPEKICQISSKYLQPESMTQVIVG